MRVRVKRLQSTASRDIFSTTTSRIVMTLPSICIVARETKEAIRLDDDPYLRPAQVCISHLLPPPEYLIGYRPLSTLAHLNSMHQTGKTMMHSTTLTALIRIYCHTSAARSSQIPGKGQGKVPERCCIASHVNGTQKLPSLPVRRIRYRCHFTSMFTTLAISGSHCHGTSQPTVGVLMVSILTREASQPDHPIAYHEVCDTPPDLAGKAPTTSDLLTGLSCAAIHLRSSYHCLKPYGSPTLDECVLSTASRRHSRKSKGQHDREHGDDRKQYCCYYRAKPHVPYFLHLQGFLSATAARSLLPQLHARCTAKRLAVMCVCLDLAPRDKTSVHTATGPSQRLLPWERS
ncbi:hypothetical protein KCU65_g272, partial [Aureobasidium melanogenum]